MKNIVYCIVNYLIYVVVINCLKNVVFVYRVVGIKCEKVEGFVKS